MQRHSTRSPFGGLLEELRAETARQADSRPRVSGPSNPVGLLRPEPELHLEAGVVSGLRAGAGTLAGPWRWVTTLAVHGVFLVAVVVLPLMSADELPEPASSAKVFFVQPALAPPPPPPAAPLRASAAAPRKSAPSTMRPAVLTAPAIAPTDIKPEDLADVTPPALPAAIADEGVPGGVEEGVPGGIVGGILQPASETEPLPRSRLRVGGEVKEPRKVKNVNPTYPEVAARGKIEGVVLLEVNIRPDGRVEDVRVLRSIPLLDVAAMDAARQWVFSPTLLGGVPVAVTMTVSVRFSLTQRASASY